MIGKTLGDRYEILEQIGEGGMSFVYKAKCHKLNRYVAIKVLKDEFNNNEEVVEKFKREATAVANLFNPNIVNILDVGTQDNVNYIVMEYIKGKTLKEIINENGKISYQTAITIAEKVANALNCAHKNNVVHRDIKPQNIMVTPDKIVKVTDFGIAKSVDTATLTFTTSIMGSAHYLSPEQAKGSFVDSRTDIYSLGIVLYEMVTGRVPFEGDSPVTIAVKHLQEAPIPPKNINSAIPQGLNNIILKCIEKDPINRYQSAKELIVDLDKVLSDPNADLISSEQKDEFTRIMNPVDVPLKTNDKQKATLNENRNYDDDYDDDDYDEDEDEEEKMSSKDKKKKKVKTVLLYILLFVGIVAAAIFAGIAVANLGNNAENTEVSRIKVPDLINMSAVEAKMEIEKLGLVYYEGEPETSDVTKGKIVRTNPAPGTDIEKGGKVIVILSAGKEKILVPDLSSYDKNEAINKLKEIGLEGSALGEKYSDDVAEGIVMEQNIAAGTEVEKGKIVGFYISKGPEEKTVKVPNVVGMNYEDARDVLNKLKLQVNLNAPVKTDDPDLDQKVFSQSIEAQGIVKEGETITISYHKYEKPAVEPPTDPGEGGDNSGGSGAVDGSDVDNSDKDGTVDGTPVPTDPNEEEH